MARILLIGPERDRASGVRTLLRRGGHQVVWHRAEAGWRDRESSVTPDLVVAATAAADSVVAAGRSRDRFPAPLLVIEHEADFLRNLHLETRLVDRLTSPFMSDELLARVDALVRVNSMVGKREEPAGTTVGGKLKGWFRSRLPERELPNAQYLEVASRVAEWADRRDAFEPGHAERVATLCAMIAAGLHFSEKNTHELLRAAMLHDIGKVGLPVSMLHKQGPLEDGQMRLIRTHPARGAALLRALDPDEGVAKVVLFHHERPDGEGYYAKDSAGVPQNAWALSVAEAYDAMTNSLLGERMESEEALDRLESLRGTAYDGDAVDALADSLRGRRATIPLSPV